MNDLQLAAHIGLGAYETPEQVLNAIASQLNNLVTTRTNEAGDRAARAAEKAVIKYSIIAGVAGVIGGGLLGWQLAKRFR